MIPHIVTYVILWLNPPQAGSVLPTNRSPLTIMTGTTTNFNPHYLLKFGGYAEVRESPNPMNYQQSRAEPAFCLKPFRNIQGS